LAASLFYVMGDEVSEYRASRDPFLHYELNPGARVTHQESERAYTVTIDEFGARLPTHRAAKAPGTFRILFFGGSTLFGAGVNDSETIPAVMERKLNEVGNGPTGGRVEVWNFGTSAYNLAQATHLARTQLVLAPDLILVQVHNAFPRPFFRTAADDPAQLMRAMERVDPYLDEEQFPGPAWVSPRFHRLAIRYSAVYRTGMGLFRQIDRSQPGFSARLAQDEARSLVRDAAARNVPVTFVAIPADRGRFGRDVSVYPGLPEGQFIDLYRADREPDFYEVHPPPTVLDEYAALLVDELRARRQLPRDGCGRDGRPRHSTATLGPGKGDP
jgi:hypothetical protein